MRDFLQKFAGNSAGKIIVALVIAVPLWALFTFVDLSPAVETKVTVTEQNVTQSTETNKTEENKDTETKEETEITEETLTKDLKIEVDAENGTRFVSNKYFAVGAYVVDENKYEFSKAITETLDNDLKKLYKEKYTVLSKEAELNIKHTFVEKIKLSENEECIIDLGDINGYNFANVYSKKDGKLTISHTIQFEDGEVTAKVIKEQFTDLSKTFKIGEIATILQYFK